jgi:rod shape-determining protein MreC
LFKWIREHRFITVIIAVALCLTVILAASFSRGGASPFGLKVQSLISSVQKPLATFTQSIERGVQGVFYFRSLADENQKLQERIARLEGEMLDLKLSQADIQELRQLSAALNYKGVAEAALKVAANVVSMDGSNHFNLFTIDTGTESGIYKDATVVNGQGLIGRIYETGKGFSKVMSVTDSNANVSFRIYRSDTESYIGIVYGDAGGGLAGYMLDTDAVVKVGDPVITSGMGLYPAGLVIGAVSAVFSQGDSLLRYIEVEPAVDFQNISKVLVIMTEDDQT